VRFLMLVKGSDESEAGVPPSAELDSALGEYTQEAVTSGAMVGGAVLQPSSKGWRVRHTQGRTTIVDGPFGQPGELIAGYALLDVASKDEAIELARRFPVVEGGELEIEIRQVYEPEEYGNGFIRLLRELDVDRRAETG
jgi:hypothetical protein